MSATRRNLSSLILLFAIGIGCSRQEEPEPVVIAEAGNSTLTALQITNLVPRGLSTTDSITWLRHYVAQWLDTELLYQYGQATGVAGSEPVRQKIEDITRRLVAGMVLDSISNRFDPQIPDSVLMNTYQAGQQEWTARDDAATLSYFYVAELLDASAVQNEAWLNPSWKYLKEKYSLRTEPSTDSTGVFLYLDQIRVLMQDPAVSYLSENRWLIRPVKGQDGKQVVLVARTGSVYRKGNILPFSVVRDDLSDRMLVKERQRRIETVLDSLKRSFRVRINIQ